MGRGQLSAKGGGGGGGAQWDGDAKNYELNSQNSGGYVVNESLQESYDNLGYTNGGETDKWMNGLSQKERDAFWHYSEDSDPYNDYMRKRTDYITNEEKTEINRIRNQMENFELEKPMIFHRGSGAALLGGASTVEEVRAMIGKNVVDDAFTSCAATRGKGFSGIRYHIMTPTGKGIGAFMQGVSTFGSSENEFLFNSGSVFKIIGAYEGGSHYKDSGLNVNLLYVGRIPPTKANGKR